MAGGNDYDLKICSICSLAQTIVLAARNIENENGLPNDLSDTCTLLSNLLEELLISKDDSEIKRIILLLNC